VKTPELARLEADLRRYLQDKSNLFSPEIKQVAAEVNRFTSAIVQDGFDRALTQLGVNVSPDRPFIAIIDAVVEHHIRMLDEPDQELVAKSLLEAYIYAAGRQYVFEPAGKTRILASLRRRGTKGFAALFFSLHLFNVISLEIQDDVHAKMPDLKSFEIYMLSVEAVCRDIVMEALSISDDRLDEGWASAVMKNIENRLLRRH